VELIAVKARRGVAPGETFTIRDPVQARILVHLGHAIEVEGPNGNPQPQRTRRKYKRRDITKGTLEHT